jgi:hypothetical protein
MNRNFDYQNMPSNYLGALPFGIEFTREKLTTWTVAGVVTMAAIMGARALMKKPRRKGRKK